MPTPPPIKAEVLQLPMRDGTVLSAHLHRPDTAERVPCIVNYTPYRKGLLGGHHPIVEHGYATLTFDIRGTGNSSGWNDSLYSAPERQDGYDVVEYAAAQPWCSGAVGMWGISFGAVAAIQTAGAAPPHLKALAVYSGSDDPYTEWTNPGGSPRPYMYSSYGTLMTALNLAPPDAAEVGDRWAAIWNERLEKNGPWGQSFIENLHDGPFFRERALRGKYDRVRAAMYVVCGWADWYHSTLLRIFAHVKSPRRALIGPWSHNWPHAGLPGPQLDWHGEVRRWFDKHLKGIDNGIDREPPVTIFVREYTEPVATFLIEENGSFRTENEWPVARRRETAMYLGGGGRLTREAAGGPEGKDEHVYDPRIGAAAGFHGGGPFNDNWSMPLDQRPDEALSLTYTTEPLEEDTEVTGPPRARLFVSSTAAVAQVCVKLCDAAPDGTSALVTKGWQNLCHLGGSVNPAPIEPGKVYAVDLELHSCAYKFRAGHRIRLTVAASDLMNVWPTPLPHTLTVHRSAGAASHVVLPIVPRQEPALPPMSIAPAAHPLPKRESLNPPSLLVTRDLINDTATVEHRVNYAPWMWNHGTYTVSAKDPATTVIKAEAGWEGQQNGRTITVEAHAVVSSDKQAFHHTVSAHITIDGKPFWDKRWSVSVARVGM